MDKLISQQAAIDALCKSECGCSNAECRHKDGTDFCVTCDNVKIIKSLPPAQPTLYGYNIGHLELIARVLQKENLPPERVVEALTDIGRIVAIVKDEFEETLRKAVEQCTT